MVLLSVIILGLLKLCLTKFETMAETHNEMLNRDNLKYVLQNLLDAEAWHFEAWLDEEELLEKRGLEIIKTVNVSKSEVQKLIDFIEERQLQEDHIYYNVLILLKDYLNLK